MCTCVGTDFIHILYMYHIVRFTLYIGINPLEGVVMLASTNRVDILDQALLRPGRFDRQILINLPTLPERKAIFEVYLKKILLEKSVDAYSSRLAALTPEHSGKGIILYMCPVSFEISVSTICLIFELSPYTCRC